MDKRKLYPMKFRPMAKRETWGGDRFITVLGKSYIEKVPDGSTVSGRTKYVEKPLTPEDRIGESWELADMGSMDSEVVNGWLEGSTISEILETYLEELTGENAYSAYGRQFPLMVRLLDVRGKMPLTVCPDDEIASQRYDTLGKRKLWYIIDAAPEARLYLGLQRKVSARELYDRCKAGTMDEVLNGIIPHKGDAYLIPPGLMHSAAGNVLIAEISESSDLDFRIYGWGDKPDTVGAAFTPDNSGRAVSGGDDIEELSLEAAFDFINLDKYDPSLTVTAQGNTDKPNIKLAVTKEFTVTQLSVHDALHIDTGTTDAFLVYVCVGGSVSLQLRKEDGEMETYGFGEGETLLVPADITDFYIVPQSRDAVLLEATVEPQEEVDAYIDPSVEAEVGAEDEDKPSVASVLDFLRKNPGRLN